VFHQGEEGIVCQTCCISLSDGPVLIHSNQGDLLRSLDSPDLATYTSPKMIALNREGYIVVNYDRGGLVSFSVNGKTLKHVSHSDNLQVFLDKI